MYKVALLDDFTEIYHSISSQAQCKIIHTLFNDKTEVPDGGYLPKILWLDLG